MNRRYFMRAAGLCLLAVGYKLESRPDPTLTWDYQPLMLPRDMEFLRESELLREGLFASLKIPKDYLGI